MKLKKLPIEYRLSLQNKIRLFLLLALLISLPVLFNIVNDLFSKYEMYFQSPVVVTTQRIFVINKRALQKPTVISEVLGVSTTALAEVVNPYDLPIKDYVCWKFGEDCEMALKVVQCESGWREESFNLNSGHSLDVGIWQINMKYQGHREQCKVTDMFDPYKNTDCAYEIYLDNGSSFAPWVCYSKGML